MVSLDTSTKSTGYAVWSSGKFRCAGLITREGDDFAEMLAMIWKFLEKEKPDIVVTELTVVVRNAQTQRRLSGILAVCNLWALLHNAYYEEIRPTVWRKYIGDDADSKAPAKRNDLKRWSVDIVRKYTGLSLPDDAADAVLIGKAYCLSCEKAGA